MPLRTYTDRDGYQWSVWAVPPTAGAVVYQERFRDGWVCFERTDGSVRCRIPLSEVPAGGWESLPDDRLDLLRRVAVVSATTRNSAQRVVDSTREAEEKRSTDHAPETEGRSDDGG